VEWIAVRARVSDAARRDRLAAALIAAGAAGVQEEPDGISTVMPAQSDLTEARALARSLADDAALDTVSLGEVDWSGRWTPQVSVRRIGHITIAPPWRRDEIRDAAGAVLIEPAMAFGTGEHETTRGMLRLMHGVIREGDFVADLGAGSAVLSIAAVRLGAARVAALESDPDAIGNAEGNVALNEVAGRVTVVLGDAALLLPLLAPVRVILANIIAPVLLQLSPVMLSALDRGGRAIVSGILLSERDAMVDSFASDGWRVLDEDVDGEWWSTVLTPA
jgi:ribosomal protein L11 methyltransferase